MSLTFFFFSSGFHSIYTRERRGLGVESNDADAQAAVPARSRGGRSFPPPPGVRRGSCWLTRLPRKLPPSRSRSRRPRRAQAAAPGLE